MVALRLKILLFLALLSVQSGYAQEKISGPVIEGFGAVWDIQNPEYKTDTEREFKVVFDIMNSPDSPSERNPSLETAARFLNMHARSGVPIEKLHVALVVHNKASKDLLTDAGYAKRYGISNPNSVMLRDLMEAGAEVVFCGQSSLSRNIPGEETIDGVKLALSAMTAIIQLTDQGYTLIKF